MIFRPGRLVQRPDHDAAKSINFPALQFMKQIGEAIIELIAAHPHHRETLANASPVNHGIYNVTGNCCENSYSAWPVSRPLRVPRLL